MEMMVEIPGEVCEMQREPPKIRRIPVLLRQEEQSNDYDPKVVSFGPFHHGKPELQLGETFKKQAFQVFLSQSGKDKRYFYNRILYEIDEIRDCYDGGVSIQEFGDADLAEMMLLDGCFAVSHMEAMSSSEKLVDALYYVGMMGFSLAHRDMFLLENQIPFRVITQLLTLRFGRKKGWDLLDRFLKYSAFNGTGAGSSSNSFIHHRTKEEQRLTQPQPLHLLDAVRRILVSEIRQETSFRQLPSNNYTMFPWPKPWTTDMREHKEQENTLNSVYTSRSVTQLKANGIYFKPSPTYCLKDVAFESYGILYAVLRLPVRFVSSKTKVLLANLIAFEICPSNVTDYAISSYVNLMKSLIHSPKDVKELREKRILISNLGSDGEVFRVFDEIHTYGMENAGIFQDVKRKIEEHHNSKAKTWMAELIHTYFLSPWNAIALFVGIFLLVLAYLQTYYTINPSDD